MTTEIITLDYPVKIDEIETSELSMRRTKLKDILESEKMSGSAVEKEVKLIANLCSIAPPDMEELDAKDYKKLQKKLKSFLG